MTFLELVNFARAEAGVAGPDLTSVQGVTVAETKRFIHWVKSEWIDLQSRHEDWQFLRKSFSFDTTSGQGYYTAQEAGATNNGLNTGEPVLADWKRDSLRVSTAGSGYSDEQTLCFIDYDCFRDRYELGGARNLTGRPEAFSIRPNDKALCFGPTPDGAYTVVGEFFRTPQELVDDNDKPLLPSQFHSLISYLALRRYGIFMSAPEVIGGADSKIVSMLPQLVSDQLPMMEAGPALA